MDKLKIVWICHFSDPLIRNNLSLKKYCFKNLIKKMIGKDNLNYYDFAPWITNLIKEFEKLTNVELHIISPHKGLKRKKVHFAMNGISYNFFKYEHFFGLDFIVNIICKKRTYRSNRKIIKGLVESIKPNIINLIGAENPYYSASVLDIKNTPIFVSLQTIYTNPDRKRYSSVNMNRWNIELAIHKKEKYYGCQGVMHRDLLLKNNPEANIFKTMFPINYPIKEKNIIKNFDFILFAASLSNKKGVEDAIEALAIVKNEYPKVTLNLVGKSSNERNKTLKQKIIELDIEENVRFKGFFAKKTDMHKFIQQARFALLPNKLDIISGTTVEAMILGLPVITYKTSGAPYLNKYSEAVLISEIEDIQGLADNMIKVLKSENLTDKLRKNSWEFIDREFNNRDNVKKLIDCYKAVIDNYHFNKPIPQELLFKLDKSTINL